LFFVLSVTGQNTADSREAKLLIVPVVTYPDEAKKDRISGNVLVSVNVNEGGEVTEAEVIKGPGAVCSTVTLPSVVAIRRTVIDAARNSKFTPALKDGQPVTSTQIITFEFGEPPAKPVPTKTDTYVGLGATEDSPPIIQSYKLNGKALSLPKPTYPEAARAVRASGAVQVQVLIFEDGSVFSAEAAGGHPLLRASAVTAACGARFTPTLLEGNPVKVSGIITYNFVP